MRGVRWVLKAAAVNKEIFWAVVDLLGAVGVWLGTFLYNTSCLTPALLVCTATTSK